jgi:hypothetical protein
MSDFADSQYVFISSETVENAISGSRRFRQSPELPLATTSSTQEPSYFTPNTPHMQNEHSKDSSSLSTPPRNIPGGPVYTRQELLNLKKSPLVAPPPGMPARKDWFGYAFFLNRLKIDNSNLVGREYNEQAVKSKDHDGLSTTRTRCVRAIQSSFYSLMTALSDIEEKAIPRTLQGLLVCALFLDSYSLYSPTLHYIP